MNSMLKTRETRPSIRTLRGERYRCCRTPAPFTNAKSTGGLGRCVSDAAAQRLHKVDDVLAPRAFLPGNRLACALVIDEVDQCRLVLVLEPVEVETAGFVVHDVPCEIEHVLRDFHVLDIVEIIRPRRGLRRDSAAAYPSGPSALVQWFERDNVLAAGQHHPPDRDFVHVADGFADHGKGIMADFAVRPQVVRADQLAGIDLAAIDEFIDLNGPRRFQRPFSSSSLLTSTNVSVSIL